MLIRLLLLFTIVPLVELWLLLVLADLTDWRYALGLVLVTGIAGAALARYEGLRCWQQVHRQMAAGQLPADPLLEAMMILVAGALLVTPGMLTDLVGFALLFPPSRRMVVRWLKSRIRVRLGIDYPPGGPFHPPGRPPAGDQIIDTRVIDVPPDETDQ